MSQVKFLNINLFPNQYRVLCKLSDQDRELCVGGAPAPIAHAPHAAAASVTPAAAAEGWGHDPELPRRIVPDASIIIISKGTG